VDTSHGTLRLVDDETVFDDAAVDLLFGGADEDWLFFFANDVAS